MGDDYPQVRHPGARVLAVSGMEPGRSAYGLRITGLDDVTELVGATNDPGDDLIPVLVNRTAGRPPELHELDGERNVRALPEGRHLLLERAAGRATFYGPAISADQLAHPYLGPIAVIVNRWSGREVFHAGAFVAAGHAWIILGPRNAGKSTISAAMAVAGIPVLADDLVVSDGSTVWAGPRSVDLRESLPPQLLRMWPANEVVAGISPSRLDTRLRLPLPVVGSRWPLGGWFFLHWDHRPGITAIGMPELLGRLARWRSMPGLPSDPARMLSLSSKPAWDMRRRRDWTRLPATVDMLLAKAEHAVSVPSR